LLPHPTRERLLPLLLVGALLLCHGAFGALHQLEAPVLSGHSTVVEHTSHQEEHGTADDHPLGAHDYAAALFALLLGMVYALLRGVVWDVFPTSRRTGSPATTRTFHLPRGPSPPFLQVFRL
jgi:ABC-type nitrate/sulfonate/bicarbonate transport system permease component